jgi:hypothetical protein
MISSAIARLLPRAVAVLLAALVVTHASVQANCELSENVLPDPSCTKVAADVPGNKLSASDDLIVDQSTFGHTTQSHVPDVVVNVELGPYYDELADDIPNGQPAMNTEPSRASISRNIIGDSISRVTVMRPPKAFNANAARMVAEVNKEGLMDEWDEYDFEYALIYQDILEASRKGKRYTRYTLLLWDDTNDRHFTKGERILFAEFYALTLDKKGFSVVAIEVDRSDAVLGDVTMTITW